MNNLRTGCLTIDIQPEFHQIALNFAKEQDSVAKGKQVYLNTLAVLVLNEFIEESSFETDLDSSDSWNPVVRCFENVADLVVEDIGSVECIPIIEDTETIILPPIIKDRPLAYVVVLLSQDLDRAQLIGYKTAKGLSNNVSEINTAQLQPIEDLIDYLFDLELANDYLSGDEAVAIRVRERLQSSSMLDIAAQFERIIRTVDEAQQQNKGVDVLAESMGIEPELVLRSANADNSKRKELEDLAKSLLDKLRNIISAEQPLESTEDDPLLDKVLQRWQQLYQQQDEAVIYISSYFGDRQENLMRFLRESIQIADEHDRSIRALDLITEAIPSEQFRGDLESIRSKQDPIAESAQSNLTDEELYDLLTNLWSRLGL